MPWTAARTRSNQEDYAAGHAARAGFEVLVPGTPKGPLFRGYALVFVVDRWRVLESTIGILSLVRFGEYPARVPDVEIERIRAMIDASGYVRLPEPPAPVRRAFRKNERVRIIGGALDGVRALHTGMRAGDRERVLLAVLGSTPRPAMVARHLVSAQ